MGPTASGKTAVAMDFAQQGAFEIISVDSAMVYRGMDIGTGKPSREELAKAPHRLIDIRDPSEPYSAADFRLDAIREIESVLANGKIPLLVGGTMLYFRALQQGLASLPAADPEIRAELAEEAKNAGWPALHKKLAVVDPEAALRIHPNDQQRIQRALEVYQQTGQPMTALLVDEKPADFNFINIAIIPSDRAVLHERIAKRFHQMLALGLVDEVKAMFERDDLSPDLPSIRAVGYRQVWAHLAGEIDYDEMVERGIIATRQLAKRQHTWLRGWEGLHAFDLGEKIDVAKLLNSC